MNFLDEIRELQENKTNEVLAVRKEILEYFRNYLESDKFKEYLKKRMLSAINKLEKTITLNISFWEYRSGCSQTNIKCCGKIFELSNCDTSYKGINLQAIHKEICKRLSNMVVLQLEELELKVVRQERHDYESRFDYYNEDIIITWNY